MVNPHHFAVSGEESRREEPFWVLDLESKVGLGARMEVVRSQRLTCAVPVWFLPCRDGWPACGKLPWHSGLRNETLKSCYGVCPAIMRCVSGGRPWWDVRARAVKRNRFGFQMEAVATDSLGVARGRANCTWARGFSPREPSRNLVNPYHWMLHESVHRLNREVAHLQLGKWLGEGLAEYFSTSRLGAHASRSPQAKAPSHAPPEKRWRSLARTDTGPHSRESNL